MSGNGGHVPLNIMPICIKNPRVLLFDNLILFVIDIFLLLRKKKKFSPYAELMVAAVHIMVAAVTGTETHLECLKW